VLQFSLESCNWFVGFIKDFIHQKKKKKKKKKFNLYFDKSSQTFGLSTAGAPFFSFSL
jgi:hypothetical protein